MSAGTPDYARALFCNEKAIDASSSDQEWAEAKNHWGICQIHLGKLDEAMGAFTEVADRPGTSQHPDHLAQVAGALFGKGVTLGKLGRGQDELTVYNDLLARFGSAAEPALREPVALALYNKGFTLGQLGRSKDALAAYDDLLARFGSAAEPALREIADDVRRFRDSLRGMAAK
ncbi:tetratricopeptide repeat protein [Skermanella pratensis]|uniref:tetratricopeptide repeat protein n=1 Tax=Skermanella pratensis TaxID=2233999 RepID=UPI001300D4D7|nr:tetratricopeptide repeat protein [Skermanella pratensis]